MAMSLNLLVGIVALAAQHICVSVDALRAGDLQVIQMATHHKTGTVLAKHIQDCLVEGVAGVFPLTHDGHWNGTINEEGLKVVHFVRHPISIVISAYLYHRQSPPPEEWLNTPVKTRLNPELVKNLVGIQPSLGETFNEFLVRVPSDAGIVFSMMLMNRNVHEMESAFVKTRSDPRVLTLCLEQSFLDFSGMVGQIVKHFGLTLSPASNDCLQRFDPSRHTFGGHSTSGTLSDEEVAQLKNVALASDRAHFGRIFTSSSNVAARCGKLSTDRHETGQPVDARQEFMASVA